MIYSCKHKAPRSKCSFPYSATRITHKPIEILKIPAKPKFHCWKQTFKFGFAVIYHVFSCWIITPAILGSREALFFASIELGPKVSNPPSYINMIKWYFFNQSYILYTQHNEDHNYVPKRNSAQRHYFVHRSEGTY